MTEFVYKAKKGPRNIVEGVVSAENFDKAVASVLSQGLAPIEVAPREEASSRPRTPGAGSLDFFFGRKISAARLTLFTRQMSNLLSAGVPILRGLGLIERQTDHPVFQQKIKEIINVVKDGGAFSFALSRMPEVFSSLYVSMVRAGELAENLDVVMDRLAEFMEKDQDVRSQIKTSLIYPTLILVAGGITIFVLLTWVIPRIAIIFDDLSESLPWPTVLLMGISHFFVQFWWLILGAGFLFWLYFLNVKSSVQGKLWLDGRKLGFPFWGDFFIKAQMGQFARTLGTLLDSGVDIVTALDMVASVMDNAVLQEEVKAISSQVVKGATLAEAVKSQPHFPETVVSMIAVGEESGQPVKGLYKLANYYETESRRFMTGITKIIEPALILVLGGIVGFVVIAMLMPIFRMNLIIQ